MNANTSTTTRRDASFTEAKAVAKTEFVTVFPHNRFFVATSKVVTTAEMVKSMKRQAADLGFDIEIVHTGKFVDGSDLVQFWLTVPPAAKRQATTVNTEEVRAGETIVAKSANLAFAPKPQRVAHMRQFVQIGDWTPMLATMEKAFVDRLFAEGLIERNPADIRQFRPTSGGRVWFNANR